MITNDEEEEEERLDATLTGSTEKQLKDFLRTEFDRNEALKKHFLIRMTGESRKGGKSVEDYKRELTRDYQEASGRHGMLDYGVELDFSKSQDLAERYIEKGNHAEAVKVYQALSEVIAENMDMVDDSDGYYGGEFESAMEGFASAINQGSMNHKDKAPRIKYLFTKYIANDDDFEEYYEAALKSICTTREDLLYWKGLLAPRLPNAIPDSRDWTRHYDAERSLLTQAYILERLGDEQSVAELYDLFRKHYRDDKEFCLLYVNRLDKDAKKDEAVRTAEEGLTIFPPHLAVELRHFLEGFYAKSNPKKHRENLKNIFFQEGDWAYYEKLRKACGPDWGDMLNEMVSHFTSRDEGRYESGGRVIDIYLREKMYDEAIRLVLGRRSLWTLDSYYDKLSPKYPNEYFRAYKELIFPYAESRMGREHYRSVVSELSKMKRIKGFETQFEEILRQLRERHANKPAFLDELTKIS